MQQLVYIPGVWDLLHVGHLTVLEAAAALGDRLIVGVPSDEVVRKDKGTSPIITLQDRLQMLSALRCVNCVLPYYRLEFLTHLQAIRPNILAVGETWGAEQRHRDAEEWVKKNGRQMVTLPYTPGISSSTIKQACVDRGK